MNDDVHRSVAVRSNLDRRRWRRVFQRVVEQLPERQRQQLAIGVDRQVDRGLRREMRDHRGASRTSVSVALDDVSKLVAIEMHRKVAGINSQHLNRIRHERLEPIQVFVDDGDQLSITGGRGLAGEQVARCRFH